MDIDVLMMGIDTESLPLDHWGKRVWISRIITATRRTLWSLLSSPCFSSEIIYPCWPIATSLLYSFVIHCIVYLNNYSIFVKLYDICHIVIHTFEWELHIEKYRIECGRSRICIFIWPSLCNTSDWVRSTNNIAFASDQAYVIPRTEGHT